MNLGEMATFICRKVRASDVNALRDCKAFLKQRYQLIYDESLWRDSIWGWDFTFTPDLVAKPESYGGTYLLPDVVGRLLALRSENEQVRSVPEEQLYRSSINEFSQTGNPVRFTQGAPVVLMFPPEYPDSDVWLSFDAADAAIVIRVNYIDANGNRQVVSQTLGTAAVIASSVRVVERATKAGTAAPVVFQSAGADAFISAPAAATAWPARIPVQLIPRPTEATALKALVKKKALPLTEDEDVPELRDCENALLALAQGDMLERGRQYGKAQAVYGEAGTLLTVLKNQHAFQENQLVQIIPAIYEQSGEVEGGFSGKGWW